MNPGKVTAPNLGDPLHAAVKITTIEGALALLQSQVGSGLQSVNSRLDSLFSEQREQTKVVAEVARQQHDLQAHSEGLDRLARAIDRNSAEFASWRKEHEQQNQNVADKVNTFRGALVGFGILGAVALTGAGLWINAEFANIRREAMDRAQDQNEKREAIASRLDKDIAALRAKVEEKQATRDLR